MQLHCGFIFLEKQSLKALHFIPRWASLFQAYRNMIPAFAAGCDDANRFTAQAVELENSASAVTCVSIMANYFRAGKTIRIKYGKIFHFSPFFPPLGLMRRMYGPGVSISPALWPAARVAFHLPDQASRILSPSLMVTPFLNFLHPLGIAGPALTSPHIRCG
jgi:hypothetical protein